MIGDNFQVLFEDVDAQTVADVERLFAAEAAEQAARATEARAQLGHFNHHADHFFEDGIGGVTFRPTVEDYFLLQRMHNETFDNPDFVNWFTRQPGGEYARVRPRSRRIIIATGGLSEAARQHATP